jgi:hypothetical protein
VTQVIWLSGLSHKTLCTTNTQPHTFPHRAASKWEAARLRITNGFTNNHFMQKHIQNLLWETPRQREYREAKARFFRLVSLLAIVLIAIIALTLSQL